MYMALYKTQCVVYGGFHYHPLFSLTYGTIHYIPSILLLSFGNVISSSSQVCTLTTTVAKCNSLCCILIFHSLHAMCIAKKGKLNDPLSFSLLFPLFFTTTTATRPSSIYSSSSSVLVFFLPYCIIEESRKEKNK